MEITAIRAFVNNHPEGVRIRIVDGKEYIVPHRDYLGFTPTDTVPVSPPRRFATSFYVTEKGISWLENSMLVLEVLPLNEGEPTRNHPETTPNNN